MREDIKVIEDLIEAQHKTFNKAEEEYCVRVAALTKELKRIRDNCDCLFGEWYENKRGFFRECSICGGTEYGGLETLKEGKFNLTAPNKDVKWATPLMKISYDTVQERMERMRQEWIKEENKLF
jgi:hypothetical protein